MAVGFVLAAAAVYAADAAVLWLRAASHSPPTGSVSVGVTLAVPQKSGRTEFIPGGTAAQACVRALFPHLGLDPCWYVERRAQRIVRF